MTPNILCGTSCWRPAWLQRYANSRTFILVYGFLGTVQAMSYMYFIVTLTTIEKRFKIPSHTTGIILSGNEISQILLSLVLSYFGGSRNRPRWIAWGVVMCALSCFILAMPHFIYGAGEDALKLTKEFVDNEEHDISLLNSTVTTKSFHRLCSSSLIESNECDELFSVIPLILIFLSQFVLGIGNTLYYSLGQSYLDDNTKKKNTPLLLGYAFSLRMFGPMVGFLVAYLFLNIYIDPSKTPLINRKDPRWLGAWWLGWIFLGIAMLFFAVLIGLFPKYLPKKRVQPTTENPIEDFGEEKEPLQSNKLDSNSVEPAAEIIKMEKAKLKDFPTALMRLLKNKLLIFNILSGIFYILGSSGYMTFLAKYIEVQFHKTTADSTIVVGPINLFGMLAGLLGSGYIITKFKPSTSKVLFWNVIIGVIYLIGQFSFIHLTCPDEEWTQVDGKINLTTSCNENCFCDGIPYSPICNEDSGITYFSACHAGCTTWNDEDKFYTDCSCMKGYPRNQTAALKWSPIIFEQLKLENDTESLSNTHNWKNTTIPDELSHTKRSDNSNSNFIRMITAIPGACLSSCKQDFFLFVIISSVINCLGSSGRIGNVLVNYRAVAVEDKSFTQGLVLMMFSLFALIPGPILFGWIIDQTCLIWNYKCGKLGNCQLYDQTNFRVYINSTSLVLTFFGIFFDFLVWIYGKKLDLYSEDNPVPQIKQSVKPKH